MAWLQTRRGQAPTPTPVALTNPTSIMSGSNNLRGSLLAQQPVATNTHRCRRQTLLHKRTHSKIRLQHKNPAVIPTKASTRMACHNTRTQRHCQRFWCKRLRKKSTKDQSSTTATNASYARNSTRSRRLPLSRNRRSPLWLNLHVISPPSSILFLPGRRSRRCSPALIKLCGCRGRLRLPVRTTLQAQTHWCTTRPHTVSIPHRRCSISSHNTPMAFMDRRRITLALPHCTIGMVASDSMVSHLRACRATRYLSIRRHVLPRLLVSPTPECPTASIRLTRCTIQPCRRPAMVLLHRTKLSSSHTSKDLGGPSRLSPRSSHHLGVHFTEPQLPRSTSLHRTLVTGRNRSTTVSSRRVIP